MLIVTHSIDESSCIYVKSKLLSTLYPRAELCLGYLDYLGRKRSPRPWTMCPSCSERTKSNKVKHSRRLTLDQASYISSPHAGILRFPAKSTLQSFPYNCPVLPCPSFVFARLLCVHVVVLLIGSLSFSHVALHSLVVVSILSSPVESLLHFLPVMVFDVLRWDCILHEVLSFEEGH